MRDFGRVPTSLWTGPVARALKGDHLAQALAAYLYSGRPANLLGLFFASIPMIAHDLGAKEIAARRAMGALTSCGIVRYDEAADLVFIPEAAATHIGATLKTGDKRHKHVVKELELIGRHPFATEFLARYGAPYSIEGPSEAPSEGPSEGASEVPRSLGEKGEGESGDGEKGESSAAAAADDAASPIRAVIAHYQTYHPRAFPTLHPKLPEWRKVRDRLRDGHTVEELKAVIDWYERDPFHQGENDRSTKFDSLELYMRDEEHVRKGLEPRSRSGPVRTQREIASVTALEAFAARGGDR